jgi:hypothetical protein
VAAANPYVDNPFRILGLPAGAPTATIRRRAQELQVEARLEGAEPEAVQRIAQAASRVQDAAGRLDDELYWIWSTHETVPAEAVSDPMTRAVVAERLDEQAGKEADDVALHDLAVLLHSCALEAPETDVPQWGPALQAWERTWRSERFWMLVRLRAADLNDPRVTDATVNDVRERLPARILSATADGAARLLASGADDRAREALAAVAASRFPSAAVQRARREATERLVAQTTDLVAGVTEASSSSPGATDAVIRSQWTVLEQQLIPTARRLKRLDAETSGVQDALDEVATCLKVLAVDVFNETKAFDTALPLMTSAVQLAGSEGVRLRMDDDLSTLHCLRSLADGEQSVRAGRLDQAVLAMRRAGEQARRDSERANVDELRVAIHGAAAGRAQTLAKARRWQEAATAGSVARQCTANPQEATQWDRLVAGWTTASKRKTSGCLAWAIVAIIAVIVIVIIAAHGSGPSGPPVEVDGTIADYEEVDSGAAYDHNELTLSGDSTTYIIHRDDFHPALPDALYHGGTVRLWKAPNSDEVEAIELSDASDQNPVMYTTSAYDQTHETP